MVSHWSVGNWAYLWEIHEHLSHLITPLAAPYIDDDIAVGEFRHGLTDDGLATAEGAWNADSPSLNTRKQGIEDTLAHDERRIGRHFLTTRPRHPNGPGVHHGIIGFLPVELELQNLFFHGVVTLLRDASDCTLCARW